MRGQSTSNLPYKSLNIDAGSIKLALNLKYSKIWIRENSGSGKTYMCRLIKQYAQDNNVSNISVVDGTMTIMDASTLEDSIAKNTGTLYVIDNFDRIIQDHPNLAIKALNDPNNQYLLIGRIMLAGCALSSLTQLVYENNTLKLEYIF